MKRQKLYINKSDLQSKLELTKTGTKGGYHKLDFDFDIGIDRVNQPADRESYVDIFNERSRQLMGETTEI